MDKLIEEEVSAQRKKKTYLIIFTTIIFVIVAIWAVRGFFKPALTSSGFTSSKAESGIKENTINATGEVLPEFEEVLASPINASIKSVLLDAGNKVKKGQSILTLDKSVTQTEYDKLKFPMESKENEISKLKLDLEKSFFDINLIIALNNCALVI